MPTLTCFHSSCSEVIKDKNRELRDALRLRGEVDSKHQDKTEKFRKQEARRKEATRQRASSCLARVLNDHKWPYGAIIADGDVEAPPQDHWRLLLGCFDPADVVWIGEVRDSGQPHHAKNFRTTAQWLEESAAPAQLTCPSVFKPGICARSNDNVVQRRFLVVESDVLKRDEVGAVFRWLERAVKLPLVAVVDTAGKSLHGWFQFPPPNRLEELKVVLPALKCDPKLFTASQPVRLPGALRDGKHQKLVYLRKEVAR